MVQRTQQQSARTSFWCCSIPLFLTIGHFTEKVLDGEGPFNGCRDHRASLAGTSYVDYATGVRTKGFQVFSRAAI
jgi:hypothetical protein